MNVLRGVVLQADDDDMGLTGGWSTEFRVASGKRRRTEVALCLKRWSETGSRSSAGASPVGRPPSPVCSVKKVSTTPGPFPPKENLVNPYAFRI